MSTRLLSVKETAARLHISESAVRKAIRQDFEAGEERLPRLPAKAGSRRGYGIEFLVPEDALADFIDQLPDWEES